MAKFEIDSGQGGILRAVYDSKVPELVDYDYTTHAPYDIFRSEPTLFVNNFTGAYKKMPAITTVSLVPDKYIKTSTIIERPAKFLLIGGITKAMEASAAIERIDTSATRAETQIEFMDMNGESVEIEGLSNDSAIVAAHGLLYATQIKLINQRNAGHKFSE